MLAARNFELVRDDLKAKHLLDLAPQFVQATGGMPCCCTRRRSRSCCARPKYAGFSLLDLHDYPGQGTALVGPLDPFWDSKGFVTPEAHRRYCGPDRAAAADAEADLHDRRAVRRRRRTWPTTARAT